MNPIQSHFMMMKKVIMSPKTFFDGVSDSESYGKVFLFAFINVIIYTLIAILFGVLGFNLNASSYSSSALYSTFGTGFVIGFNLFMIPVIILMLFIGAGIFHVIAKILGGKGTYKGSFSVLGYTTALTPFTAIPIIGPIISFYGIYINIVGFRRIHKYSTARAVVTILIPVVIIAIFVIGVIALGVLAALSLSKSGINPSNYNYQNQQNIEKVIPQEVQNQMQQIQDTTSTYTYPTGYDDYINQ